MSILPQYLYNSLLEFSDKDIKKYVSSLYGAIVGGERCEINTAQSFYDKTGIVQMSGYGASEAGTTFSVTHPNCNKVGSSGIPLPFNNVRIVDSSFNDVSYGQPGRLLITTPGLMNGYYKREDLTKMVMIPDAKGVTWYYTGDYAYMDNDGCLYVLDRYKEPVTIKTDKGERQVQLLDEVEVLRLFIKDFFIAIEEDIVFNICQDEPPLRLSDDVFYNYLNYNTNI